MTDSTITDGIKILIEMDKNGNYTIKEWDTAGDSEDKFELDEMMLEIYKNKDGHYQMIEWKYQELYDMIAEMVAYQNNDYYWKQVMEGYQQAMDSLPELFTYNLDSFIIDMSNGTYKEWFPMDFTGGNKNCKKAKRERRNKHQRDQAMRDKKAHMHFTVQEYTNYRRSPGKCRLASGKFRLEDVYQAGGPKDPVSKKKSVKTMSQCMQVCQKDANCDAFHFWLLDPGAKDNCWIWSGDYVKGNGQGK